MSSGPKAPPLPGFGLPLKQESIELFPSALDPNLSEEDYKGRLPALTLRELAMLNFMNQVTDKKDWEIKVFDETITRHWRLEMLQNSNLDFTERMANYCIDELKYKANIYKKFGLASIYNGDVVKSDTAIPAELQSSLKMAVATLEDVPSHKKDWHPGSNEQVLDLVHPSLFPLVYGLSRILKDDTTNLKTCISRCGEGEVVPEPQQDQSLARRDSNAYSRKFQWLPCDIDVSANTPKIVSYINNLHPRDHVDVYHIIEKIVDRIIPLWNATLTPLRELDPSRRIVYGSVDYDYASYDKWVEDEGPKKEEGEDEDEYDERLDEWKWDNKSRFLVKPDVRVFCPPSPPPEDQTVDLKRDYGDTGLQVIVKLANIHLTPEKPKYNGGTWHIEGQLNEHICATAIYYYDCKNITSSRLAFRQAVNVEDMHLGIPYEQNDNSWIDEIFGLRNWAPGVQEVGSIKAREGRLVTFPNILQHQVQPFELLDPTQSGHRKILALFLVDPNIKIISTANIPCQRRDWWGETVTSDTSPLAKLPAELRDKVVQDVEDFPISLERAKELREELMEERKAYVVGYQEKNFTSTHISLCEH